MSRSVSGVHSPELATRWPPGSVVQLPAPRRLVRWPVSRSSRYAAVTVVRLTFSDSASSRSAGSRMPSGSRPSASRPRTAPASAA